MAEERFKRKGGRALHHSSHCLHYPKQTWFTKER